MAIPLTIGTEVRFRGWLPRGDVVDVVDAVLAGVMLDDATLRQNLRGTGHASRAVVIWIKAPGHHLGLRVQREGWDKDFRGAMFDLLYKPGSHLAGGTVVPAAEYISAWLPWASGPR